MLKGYRSVPLIFLLVVLIVFAFTQWLPLLLLLPGGAAMMLAGKNGYATNPYQKPQNNKPPYE
ncbi:hypothetical protein CQ018_08415 [Arthrobacter sp. MYb227]|nr:hypothetical protein CQ018_08415 [Arthrobacter sp. MYb227]